MGGPGRLKMTQRSEPVDLDIHCASCGGAVTAQFQDWTPGGPATEAIWPCPYCRAANKLGAVGAVGLGGEAIRARPAAMLTRRRFDLQGPADCAIVMNANGYSWTAFEAPNPRSSS
jgi:hypothetical protein